MYKDEDEPIGKLVCRHSNPFECVCESRMKRTMASKIQSPESFEKQNTQTLGRCHSDSSQLQLVRGKNHTGNNDYEHQVFQQLQHPFQIASNSPLSNNFEGDDSTWPERLTLPINDFDRYDREPPSCSAYETIASDSLDEGLHGSDNCYGNRFPQEGCDIAPTKANDVSSSDLCKDIAIQQQIDGLDVSSCLEWPTIQQDALAFNELSDVIVDSYRLNKETAILLKLLDEGIIPPNAALCVSNDGVSKYSLADHNHVSASHSQHTLPRGTIKEHCPTETGPNGEWSMQPSNATCSYDADMQSYLAYEAKLEKQHRRKEKNRECSRNFRYKQRMKEDCLKRGKLNKEDALRRRLYERERLRNALVELARNCASCPRAMEFLSPYHESHEKENVPVFFEAQTEFLTG